MNFTFNGPYHTGIVRWNGSMRSMEVMDQGGGWQQLSVYDSNPAMPPDTQELLQWAREEKTRKLRLKSLRAKYPILDDALGHAEVIEALVNDYNESSNQSNP